jgi:hypothetical protein
MSLVASLKKSWYLGRGSRALNKCNYKLALKYFNWSLDNARKSNDNYEIIIPLESLAETLMHLNQNETAKLHALECREMCTKLSQTDKSGVFKKSLNRVNNLLDKINQSEEQDQQK